MENVTPADGIVGTDKVCAPKAALRVLNIRSKDLRIIDGFDFYLPESLELGESIIDNTNGFFTFRNENGDDVAPNKVDMLVIDLANNDVTNRFTLRQSGVGMYLETNDYFYFA